MPPMPKQILAARTVRELVVDGGRAAPPRLRGHRGLEVACYFRKGHLESPSHVLGTMMPCPQCRKDITLKVGRERMSGK